MKDVTKKEAGEEGPFPGAHTILPPGLPSTSPWVLEAPASSSAHDEISWMRWCLQYSGEQGGMLRCSAASQAGWDEPQPPSGHRAGTT